MNFSFGSVTVSRKTWNLTVFILIDVEEWKGGGSLESK
jgi:hypothetical protein